MLQAPVTKKDPFLKRFFVTMIATALGSGFTPKAPGTAGSVVGVFLIYLLRDVSLAAQAAIFLAVFFVGWWASLEWSRAVQSTDSQKIVIDEVLGMMLAMAGLPVTGTNLLIQFVLFRILDAWKPWPIRKLDRWGKNFPIGPVQSFMVIFDDLLAGLAALGIFKLLSLSGF